MSVNKIEYTEFECDETGKTVVVEGQEEDTPKNWVLYRTKLPDIGYEKDYHFSSKLALSKWLNKKYKEFIDKELESVETGTKKKVAKNKKDLDFKKEVITFKAAV